MTDDSSHHSVLLYTKEGCCLCDHARAVLRRLERDFELDVREVDITGDPALFEQYRYTIPVVIVDGQHRFEANRIAEHYLRRALESGQKRWPWRR